MLGDILENFSDQELADTALYNSIIQLLNEVKLVHGGQGLQSTIKRHRTLTNFLCEYQRKYIIDLESKISNNHCIISKS